MYDCLIPIGKQVVKPSFFIAESPSLLPLCSWMWRWILKTIFVCVAALAVLCLCS